MDHRDHHRRHPGGDHRLAGVEIRQRRESGSSGHAGNTMMTLRISISSPDVFIPHVSTNEADVKKVQQK